MALSVTEQQLKLIRAHAEGEYPAECCGVLLGIRNGNTREVVELTACSNAAMTPRTRYEIGVVDLVRVQRTGRERGLEIVGFYHSHPEHEAMWSERDLRDAEWPGCSFLIVEVRTGVVRAERSFEMVSEDGVKRFVEETMTVK